MFKKCICLTIAIVMLVSAMLGMVSCKKGNGDNGDGATTPAPTGSLALVENNEAAAKIVFKISSSAYVTEAAELLQSFIENSCGVTVGREYDDMHKPADGAVVLIGDTQYAESTDAMAALADNSYSISVSDNKIIIVANNSYLYSIAIQKLIENLSVNGGAISIAKDYSFKSESYSALTVNANDYRIVYASGSKDAQTAANEVKLGLQNAGVSVQVVADTQSAKGKEILVGATNRALSKFDANKDYKCGIIKKDDSGNIALTGNFAAAGERFAQYAAVLAKDGKGMNFIDPMFGAFAPDGMGWAPNYTGSGTVEVKDSFEKSGSYTLFIHNATKNDYKAYLEVLANAGFECYHSTTANGNSFSTYTDGYNILTLSHLAYYDPATKDHKTASNGDVSYMTVGVDCIKNSALPERNTEIEDITTEQITTVSTVAGYVLRLSDGRFVVFDGGTADTASTVYNIICEQNVRGGKPVIAAWFLTHGHVDHIGAILSFVTKYSTKVEVQSFVHHLPPFEQYDGKNVKETNPEKECTDLYNRSVTYYNDITKYYPKADIIVARAGQRFEYGNIDIDVLFTPENLYKKVMLDTNASSVVYSITGDSGRMLVLGDLVDPAGGVLNAIYEDELDCDLVQVAHHGYNNGNTDMYDSINAEYAIWTNSKSGIVGYKNAKTRNFFDHTSVSSNVIPNGPAITLTENMTKADIVALNVDMSDYSSAGSLS